MEGTDEVERRVRADIARHGWHVVIVPPEDDAPGWAHTIGLLERYAHPELLVFGSAPQQLGALVNALGARVRAGRRLGPGDVLDDVLEGLPFALREVAPRWVPVFLGNAAWHYQRENLAVVQGFWPDRQGRFPWQPECLPEVCREQPRLEHAAIHEALSEPLVAALRRDGAL